MSTSGPGSRRRRKAFATASTARRLHRFDVALYDPAMGQWDDHDTSGCIVLPDYAPRHHVESALAVVNVYAPRGADKLEWLDLGVPAAVIHDQTGMPLVRLWKH